MKFILTESQWEESPLWTTLLTEQHNQIIQFDTQIKISKDTWRRVAPSGKKKKEKLH